MTRAKSAEKVERQGKISKHEIRNSKQIQMIEKHKIQNILASDSAFLDFPILRLFVFEFVSDFDIRISDFE